MRPALCLNLLIGLGCGGPLSNVGGSPPPTLPAYLVYVRDREGSVLAAVDDQGKTFSKADDEAFGLRLSSTGTPVPREFLDKELDEETGFYHFHSRYYDPATAQWLSPDPKLLSNPDCSARVQGCNPYAFAGNRPLEWTDSDGREIVTFRAPDGTPTLLITAGFYGPAAASARDVFVQGVLKLNGSVRVVALTAVYDKRGDVPQGATPIEAPGLVSTEGGGARSYTENDLSGIHLGSSVFEDNLPARSQFMEMLHEVFHAAGKYSEGYWEGPEFTLSKPGHYNGVGGNYWRDPDVEGFTATEAREVMDPERPDLVNSQSRFNAGSFFPDLTLNSAVGGGGLPAAMGPGISALSIIP